MGASMAHQVAGRLGDDGDGDVHTSDCKEHSGTSVADSEEGSGFEEDEEDRVDLEANEERDEEEEGDCEEVKTVFKPRQKAGGRKRSSSTSEEEMANKKPCCLDESDGNNRNRPAGRDLPDKQLLQVAKTLGKEWEQVAIHLELKTKDLDDIKADRQMTVAMQKLKMFVLWKR
ncbi:unnamed protein product [Gadus morhua 'NCC']